MNGLNLLKLNKFSISGVKNGLKTFVKSKKRQSRCFVNIMISFHTVNASEQLSYRVSKESKLNIYNSFTVSISMQ